MDKLSEIKRLWRECFNDSRQWMTEVFPQVYCDEDTLTIADGGSVASMLMLRRYSMLFHGAEMPVGYIYGAATSGKHRMKGLMHRLVGIALRKACGRGDVFVFLRPATRRLYSFYDGLGFSTVFYIDEQRYTSVHEFVHDRDAYIVEDAVYDTTELSCAYRRLASARSATVLHDEGDFRTILSDWSLDGGLVGIARSADTGAIAAIGFAMPDEDTVCVREIVADNDDAANAVFDSFASRCPCKMTVVESYPEREGITYRARGMARIVNVKLFMEKLGEIDRDLAITIRCHDPLVSSNNGVFHLKGGVVSVLSDGETPQNHIDLDVDVATLTSIVFSSRRMGVIFGMPSARPFMSLMLD